MIIKTIIALAIVFVTVVTALLGMQIPTIIIQYITSILLIGLGIYHIFRNTVHAHTHHTHVNSTIIASSGYEATGFIVHTLGYFAMASLLASVIYEKLGLAILKKAWINFDIIWAGTLIITGGFLLFLQKNPSNTI